MEMANHQIDGARNADTLHTNAILNNSEWLIVKQRSHTHTHDNVKEEKKTNTSKNDSINNHSNEQKKKN